MITLLLPAAAVLWIALAVYGAGSRLAPGESVPAERWTWGLAAWCLALFALAGLGLFRPPFLLGLAVLSAALAVVPILRANRRSDAGSSWLVPSLAFAVPLGLVFAITVNPTISWDAAVYHLTLPDLYLREGGFRVIPFLVYGVWPQAVELFFGLALAMEGYAAAKALHFGFGVLVAVTLFASVGPKGPWSEIQASQSARQGAASSTVAGLVAVGLFLLNDVVLFEMRAAYVDLAMAFFALAAFLLLERWREEEDDRRLIGAGLALGLLASTKINGIVTAACLLALALPRLVQLARLPGRRPGQRLGRPLLALGLPVAMLWAPWLVRTWATTGNPIYPLAWNLFGGPDWNARLGEQFLAWQRSIGMGREPLDYLLLPWRVFTAGGTGYEHFDGRLTPLWLIFLPLAFWRATRSPRARRALVAAGLVFTTWALGSQQMRFLIPLLPLLALAVADGVVGVLSLPAVRRRSGRRPRVLVWTAVLSWLLAFGVTQTRLVTAGWSHLQVYADPRFERPERPPSSPVFGAVSQLPEGSTVLLLNSNHLFHCRPTLCLGNSFFEAPQIDVWLATADSAEEVAQRLTDRGVTHVAWAGRPRFQHAALIFALLDRPDLAQPVYARGPDRLWKLQYGRVEP